MAKSVLELAVGTGQWDAGLKKAKSALDNFTQSQGGLQQALAKDSENMRKFVGMMGSFESTAKTAKGQMNDYKSTIEQLTMQYNRMTDAQKQSIGPTYLQSIDQLKQKYQAVNDEIQEMTRSLNNIKTPDVSNIKEGLFGGDKLSGMLQVFGGNLMTKGAGMLAGLASEMGDAVKQGIELAKQGEGVRIAFERLGRGDILDGLREATHGTVTDLELMKAAVKFNDFKLPVEELGTMLAFAQQKAKDTGQSVDYMVDSIVTGLGRKSLMILDNLGLSAAEIKEKMKETGDMTKAVGAIIREQMTKAGDYVETAADRAAQANVNMQNKMEELGRKFAPLQEASNSLWTSMKIGILDVIGGPLTDLLNKLTEAGRLRNALNNINGDGTRGNTQVANKLKQLQAAKKSGASQYMLDTMQSGVVEGYNRQINEREQAIKDWKSWRSGNRSEGLQQRIEQWRDKYGTDVNAIKAEADAYRTMIAEYRKGAKDIMTPVTVDVKTDNAVKSLDELKVKLAELQAQRKKVAAGSDEAKRLDTEIRQVKADIKLQDPNALKTTHTTTPQEKASEMVSVAERTYAETLQKSAIRMEAGLDSTLQGKKTELSAQERLFDAYNDAYATYKDPKYKEAAAEAADKIKSLAGEVKGMEDAVKASKIKWEEGASGFNDTTMSAWMQGRQGDLSKAEFGSADYSAIQANIADMNAIKTVLEQSVKAGINAAQFDLEPLWEKIFDGENIDDTVWQGMVDVINEKLQELHLDPIKLDFQTGNIKKESKEMAKDWQAAGSAIQAVGNAMQQIEDPAAKVLGTIAQAVATMALSYAQAAASPAVTSTGWGWIAFAATGVATMLSSIAAIKNATSGFANGGIIPGNSMSGDNMVGMTPDGSVYGLNAQEVVLNRAQVGNLASQLEGGAGLDNIRLEAIISGEDIILTANNRTNRVGYQELLKT